MFSPLVLWMAELKQDDLLAEAQKNQAVVPSRNRSARLAVRILVGMGVFLISMGLRLQERYQPKMRPVHKSCGPACG